MAAPAEIEKRRAGHSGYVVLTSAIVTVATTITLDEIEPGKPHCFAGAQFFANAGGTTPATPGAGTIDVTIKTVNTDPVFETIPASVITAAVPTTVSWAANALAVKAVPSGVTTATHWRIVVTCNET